MKDMHSFHYEEYTEDQLVRLAHRADLNGWELDNSPAAENDALEIWWVQRGTFKRIRERDLFYQLSPLVEGAPTDTPAPSALPADSSKKYEQAILEAWRGWFLMHTSGENCLNTLLDVFTAMREELEDDEAMLPMIRAIAPPPSPDKSAGGTARVEEQVFLVPNFGELGTKFEAVSAVFARTLERELALQTDRVIEREERLEQIAAAWDETKARLQDLTDQLFARSQECAQLKQERDEAREHAERARSEYENMNHAYQQLSDDHQKRIADFLNEYQCCGGFECGCDGLTRLQFLIQEEAGTELDALKARLASPASSPGQEGGKSK